MQDGERALTTILPGAIRTVPGESYALAALQLASRHGGGLYDAIYVAVAQTIKAPLITADEAQAAIARGARHKVFLIAHGVPPRE